MRDFEITSQELPDNNILICIKGFLDTGTYNDLGEMIYKYFGQNQYRFIIDLSQTNYVSSAGVMILIGAVSVARENKGKIVLFGLQPNVKEVFDMLGFSQMLTIADNKETALRLLRS